MKLNSIVMLLFVALLTACKGSAYDLSSYGLNPDTGENASPLMAKALQQIAAESNSDTVRIFLPKGRYDFYPTGASEREYFISNHDQDNPKQVGLAFENMKNVVFDGQGSELVFHGRMLPVSLVGSDNCTLKNFSIDFANPHISQVKVLENDTLGGMITYEVAPWVEYEIRDSNFVAKGKVGSMSLLGGSLLKEIQSDWSIRPVISAWAANRLQRLRHARSALPGRTRN